MGHGSRGGAVCLGCCGARGHGHTPSPEALRPCRAPTEASRKPWERSGSAEKPVSSSLSR